MISPSVVKVAKIDLKSIGNYPVPVRVRPQVQNILIKIFLFQKFDISL